MASTRSNHGRKVSASRRCEECYKIDKIRDQNPSEPKYCVHHQCPAKKAPGVTCPQRKKRAEKRCPTHTIPPCIKPGCEFDRAISSLHCELHSCTFSGCQKEARPGKGKDYCQDHKCRDEKCEHIRKRVEYNGQLRLVEFCRDHECQTEECAARKYPDKDYCVEHCCNTQGCRDKREGGPLGPVCLHHHDDKVASEAKKEHEERIFKQQKEEARQKQEMETSAAQKEAEIRDRLERENARMYGQEYYQDPRDGLRHGYARKYEGYHPDEGYKNPSRASSAGVYEAGNERFGVDSGRENGRFRQDHQRKREGPAWRQDEQRPAPNIFNDESPRRDRTPSGW